MEQAQPTGNDLLEVEQLKRVVRSHAQMIANLVTENAILKDDKEQVIQYANHLEMRLQQATAAGAEATASDKEAAPTQG